MAVPHGHGSVASANGPRQEPSRADRPSPLTRASNLAYKAMVAGRTAEGERRGRLHKAYTKASAIRGRLLAESEKGRNRGNPDHFRRDDRGRHDSRTGGFYTGD